MKREETTAKRRRLIVESAAECFIEGGFHQTSIRDIAKKAGISLGNLYNHFGSKSELIAEIATIEAEELSGLIDELQDTGSGIKTVLVILTELFDEASKVENAILFAEITTEAIRNEEVAEPFEANRDKLVDALSIHLDGKDANSWDAHDLSALLLDLVEGAAFRAAFENRKEQARIKQTLVQTITVILNQ